MTDRIRAALQRLTELDGHTLVNCTADWAEAMIEARAALAEPDGPTLQLPEQAPDGHPPSNLDRREVAAWYHGHACGWQAARAVLARWGRPAPAPAGERQAAPVPVAVSERPWEREGWCHPQERWAWFYNRRVGWRDAIPPESLKPPTLFPYTHSVPFNALPLPSGEVEA